MIKDTYRRAIVTGASSGIGKSIMEALRGEGLEVHAVALPGPELEAAARQAGATPHGFDVSDTAAVEKLLASCEADVLVNNAGILGAYKPVQTYTREDVDRLIAVNLSQAIHFARVALPGMIARKRGHIVFLGSIAGRIPGGGYSVYAATKAGILAFAEGVRWDVLGTGVRTTVLIPGRVQTHIYDQHFGGHEAAHRALYEAIRPVQPEDIARATLAALAMPLHVDVTTMEIMPTEQVFGGSRTAG